MCVFFRIFVCEVKEDIIVCEWRELAIWAFGTLELSLITELVVPFVLAYRLIAPFPLALLYHLRANTSSRP